MLFDAPTRSLFAAETAAFAGTSRSPDYIFLEKPRQQGGISKFPRQRFLIRELSPSIRFVPPKSLTSLTVEPRHPELSMIELGEVTRVCEGEIPHHKEIK